MTFETTRDFKVGQRVQLHPATDAWMSGDQYGTVTRITKSTVWVRMDKSHRTYHVRPADIYEIVE